MQTIMGRATIGMTFDQYGHLFSDDLAAAAQRANAWIAAGVAGT